MQGRMDGTAGLRDRRTADRLAAIQIGDRTRHPEHAVARTVADLDQRERVSREDVLRALSLRQRTGPDAVLVA